MKKRFRISKNDTIKATLCENGRLLCSLYDSNYTNIDSVVKSLICKVPYTNAKKLDICITNETKQTYKTLSVAANR